MTGFEPPRAAAWVLRRLARTVDAEALIGDLAGGRLHS
jgi:hypothetical protein